MLPKLVASKKESVKEQLDSASHVSVVAVCLKALALGLWPWPWPRRSRPWPWPWGMRPWPWDFGLDYITAISFMDHIQLPTHLKTAVFLLQNYFKIFQNLWKKGQLLQCTSNMQQRWSDAREQKFVPIPSIPTKKLFPSLLVKMSIQTYCIRITVNSWIPKLALGLLTVNRLTRPWARTGPETLRPVNRWNQQVKKYIRLKRHRSRLTCRLTHLSFYLSCSLPLPTQAGQAATDVSQFDPPAPAASARVRSVTAVHLPPLPARLSPTTLRPARRLTGACQEPEHGRAGGGRWATRYVVALLLVAGVRLHMKKGVLAVTK